MFAIIARTSECRSENVDNYDYNHEDSNGRVIPENYKDKSQKEYKFYDKAEMVGKGRREGQSS